MVENAVHSQRIADRFEIRDSEGDLVGRGSMGEVYRATDTHNGEPVAVKALDPRVVARDPSLLERFVREGEALRQLDHPNIVRMVAAVEDQDRHFLVMEYVAGGSLQDLLGAQRTLPVSLVLEIALDLADALTRAHRLGIIHRDLKPANVLLAEDGTPRLTDFGIARVLESPRLTQTGVLVGTPDFLSPEACRGEALDERTDIWAFGVMLYEMLTGESPFPGDNLTAKLTAILTQPVPDLVQCCPDAPEALADLVYRMLEKDREGRIPSVRLVGAELEAILKGREMPTPVRLAPGESRFAPPSLPTDAPQQPQVTHNLPAQLTSFVGRERETAEVVHLLGTTRLLTLTGPPGTGKTRLGLKVAAKVLDQYQDGVFFVDLAPIRDPGLVATTIAQVLGIGEPGGQPLLDTLKSALRHKHLLLLLDNFEQVVGSATLLGELLSSSAGLKALVTSREALRVYGEQEYPVPPLALPDLDRAEPLHSLSQYEAVELFMRRACAVRPDFILTDDNAPAVAEICVRLDGLPLAIELAAARCTVLSPEMMLRRLESRLGVLVAGPRDLPARQRTLRGTIDWSYDLLDPPEKTLFARLAVFQGGRTLAAVEAVCSHGLAIDVMDGLESLLNKNLLRQEVGQGGEQRFVMLEMLHEYAWERLEASGEAEVLQRRHAEYFLALTERAEPELRGARQQHWFVRLRAEQDNLRSALAWSLGEGEAELGLRLVGALRDFWFFDGHSAEGLAWTERTLESGQGASPPARAGALNAAGYLCVDTGDYEKGKTCSGAALAIYRQVGDEVGSAWALIVLSIHAVPFPSQCKEGIALAQEGLAIFRESGHKPGIMQALTVLGELGRVVGNCDQAQEAYEECLALSRETGHKLREAITLGNLGSVAQHRGLPGKAGALFAETLALLWELGDKKYSAMYLDGMARSVAALGQPRAAARILGASEALLEAMGIVMHPVERSEIDRHVAAVREQLDGATFDAAWAEGRAMSLEQAVSYALEAGQLGPAAPPPASAREPEVPKEIAPESSQLEQDYRARLKARYAEDAAYFVPLAGETTEVVSKREPTAPRSTRRRKRRAQSAYHEWVQKGQDIKRVKLETLREAVDKYPCIILLGDPGSGKTTALENLAYQFADEPDRLPVPLRLSEFGSGMSLDEFILQGWGGSPEADYWGASELAARLEYYLDAGRLFILFDALNEMPHEGYRERTLALRHFIDEWSAKGNRFLVTCRVLDYGEELSGLQRVEVQPLNDEQIKTLLQKELPETWQRLWQSLTESSDDQCHLLGMARNPYVLTIMIDVFDQDGR
ncbi:MAG: protein kinase, partial [Anaerolineae bacterium]